MAELTTINGYPIEDLMFMSVLCKEAEIEPADIKELKDNLGFCYELVMNDFKKQMLGISDACSPSELHVVECKYDRK